MSEWDETNQEAGKTILVVEDDVDIGEILLMVLVQETPYQPLLATDGFAALRLVKSIKPHLFIIDYRLPNMDGLELYDRLQQEEAFKPIPTIFMSASLDVSKLEHRHITTIKKPFDIDEMLGTIEKLLEEGE